MHSGNGFYIFDEDIMYFDIGNFVEEWRNGNVEVSSSYTNISFLGRRWLVGKSNISKHLKRL